MKFKHQNIEKLANQANNQAIHGNNNNSNDMRQQRQKQITKAWLRSLAIENFVKRENKNNISNANYARKWTHLATI